MRGRVNLAALSCAAVVTLTLAGCSSGSHSSQSRHRSEVGGSAVAVDGPDYEAVEQVLAKSELYVRGVAGLTLGSELDGGGNRPETEANSVRVIFVALTVTGSSNEGIVRTGSVIPVLWEEHSPSQEGQPGDPPKPGDEVVVLAVAKSHDDAPGIDSVTSFLAPVGGEAGVLDVLDGSVTPNDPNVVGFEKADVAAVGADAECPPSVPTSQFLALGHAPGSADSRLGGAPSGHSLFQGLAVSAR